MSKRKTMESFDTDEMAAAKICEKVYRHELSPKLSQKEKFRAFFGHARNLGVVPEQTRIGFLDYRPDSDSESDSESFSLDRHLAELEQFGLERKFRNEVIRICYQLKKRGPLLQFLYDFLRAQETENVERAQRAIDTFLGDKSISKDAKSAVLSRQLKTLFLKRYPFELAPIFTTRKRLHEMKTKFANLLLNAGAKWDLTGDDEEFGRDPLYRLYDRNSLDAQLFMEFMFESVVGGDADFELSDEAQLWRNAIRFGDKQAIDSMIKRGMIRGDNVDMLFKSFLYRYELLEWLLDNIIRNDDWHFPTSSVCDRFLFWMREMDRGLSQEELRTNPRRNALWDALERKCKERWSDEDLDSLQKEFEAIARDLLLQGRK